jgi:hypothetical protein
MPSTSAKQAKFMAAAAHNATFAKQAGIPQSVAKEFHAADKAKAKDGGQAQAAKADRGTHLRHIKPYVSGSRSKRG